ncbi:hypothetical protein HYDPIDRAFT_113057 [Hydnomerulius pinastri MD-312]|uniref:MYND-type domain-containing protein n=1 Tax=Hydnomerulius pinastri MD-312 TaxID=994086 RepID=A0A0C9VDG1_9AGAM|nr:hypothetical protein HYDPIDRAFT_113057 [Hydnomerulius pinastri MD-312]
MPLTKKQKDIEIAKILMQLTRLRMRNEERVEQHAAEGTQDASTVNEPDAETNEGVASIMAQLLRLRVENSAEAVDPEEEREDLEGGMGIILDAFGLPKPKQSEKKKGRKKKKEVQKLTAAGKPRWTRKDIPRLPKVLLKGYTPEELDDLFDDDGYLLDFVQSMVDNDIAGTANVCYVWKKLASSKCSKCKMIYYCSKECQRSHWKTHKPTCLMIRDPLHFSPDYAEEEMKRNPEFAQQMVNGVNMRTRGRKYDTVEELMRTWMKACPFGGDITVTTSVGTHMFVVLRDADTGVIQLHHETIAKPLKTPRPHNHHKRNPADFKDVVKHIADYVEAQLRTIRPPLLSVYAEFMTISADEIDFSRFNQQRTRRGAEITWRGTHSEVIQFEPDGLKQSDEWADPGKNTGTLYPW